MSEGKVITIEQATKMVESEKMERSKNIGLQLNKLLRENNCELEVVLNIKNDGTLIPQYKVVAK